MKNRQLNLQGRLARAAGILAVAGMISGVAGQASAHHSFAMFDRSAGPQKLAGTVKQWDWTNPHSWLMLTVGSDEYQLESSSPMELTRKGWNRNIMKPGDKVSIQYFPFKNGKKGGQLAGVTLADGTVLGGGSPFGGPPGSPPAEGGRGGPPGGEGRPH
jgi:hypothetical protein